MCEWQANKRKLNAANGNKHKMKWNAANHYTHTYMAAYNYTTTCNKQYAPSRSYQLQPTNYVACSTAAEQVGCCVQQHNIINKQQSGN